MSIITEKKSQYKTVTKESICLTLEDMELFSEASYDVNPIHCSEDYARKTPFGSRIMFGMLAEIACLGRLQPHQNTQLSKVSVEFPNAMYPGVEYKLEKVENFPDKATVNILVLL